MVTGLKRPTILCLFLLLTAGFHCLVQGKEIDANKKIISKQAWTGKMSDNGWIKNKKRRLPQISADSTIIHIVKKGETLYSISNAYGVQVAQLKQWNHLSSNSIQIGEKLKIYPRSSTHPASSTDPEQKKQAGTGKYTVKPNDTLFHIAQMYQMSVEQLKAINGLSSNTIQVGQKLIVETGSPASAKRGRSSSIAYGKFTRYTVQKSIPVDSLLQKFEMGKAEFMALNPDISKNTLAKGTQVEVLIPAKKVRKNPYRVHQTVEGLGMMPVTRYPANMWGTTTNGELYNPNALTAGSSTLKIGSVIFLKNKQNGRGVFVRINDRTKGAGLTLSEAAWNMLRLTGNGHKVMVFRTHE